MPLYQDHVRAHSRASSEVGLLPKNCPLPQGFPPLRPPQGSEEAHRGSDAPSQLCLWIPTQGTEGMAGMGLLGHRNSQDVLLVLTIVFGASPKCHLRSRPQIWPQSRAAGSENPATALQSAGRWAWRDPLRSLLTFTELSHAFHLRHIKIHFLLQTVLKAGRATKKLQ